MFFFLDDCDCHEIEFFTLSVSCALLLSLKNVDFALRILSLRAEKNRLIVSVNKRFFMYNLYILQGIDYGS
jgi:hypothetical protein